MKNKQPNDARGQIVRLVVLLIGGCAAIINLAAWMRFPTAPYLMGAAGFGLMTFVWYRWLPADFFAAPFRDLFQSLPKQSRSEEMLTIVGSLLIIGSVLLRAGTGQLSSM